ncbi:hypothetical protein BJY52DRAFT_1267770 [Lactarius psammicola]|nr:hypothetical protein BJY52DRAFT_1267770 [Lactarius psammicola]
MPRTEGSVWSFNLRSYNPNDFSDSESDDALPDNLCSDGSTLVDQPLTKSLVYSENKCGVAFGPEVCAPSQEIYDVPISKRNKTCEKKQPQGRIVDLLKKQAQQPPSGKGSGLRPLDASLSGNGRKTEGPSKSSTISDSFPTVLSNRHHLGKCDNIKAVDSTRHIHNVPCDADPLPMNRRAIHTKTALPVFSSNTRTDSRLSTSGDCATQSSATSRSGSLFQSAQELSTRASIGQSLLGSCIPAIPPQPTKGPDVSRSLTNQTTTSVQGDSGTPSRTCLPLEFQTQERSVIEGTSTHDIVDGWNAFPIKNPQGAQTKLSEARAPQPQEGVLSNVESRPRSQSAIAVSASQSKLDSPVLTHQRINVTHTALSPPCGNYYSST